MEEMDEKKYMKMAISEAKRALKKGEVPIGAIIIKDGKVISKGHNERETKANSLCHAEIIAINKACKKLKNFRLEDCIMYVTLEPCCMCAGAIVQSRIKKVIFGAKDEKYGAVCSIGEIFDLKSNHRVEYEQGIMSDECSIIIKNFFKELRDKKRFK